MDSSSEKNYKQMHMIINNVERLITVISEVIIMWEDGEFAPVITTPSFNKPIGYLLFSFINADFTDIEGFKKYVSVWGISGFTETVEYEKIEYSNLDSSEEKEVLLQKIYDYCKDDLIDAQDKFRKVVDYCANAEKIDYLEGLTASMRFYVGRHFNKIPDIEDYNEKLFVLNSIEREYSNSKDKLSEMKNEYEYDIQELCNSIKKDNTKIEKEYQTRSILTLIYHEFYNLLDNFDIKKCENCGTYFIPQYRSNEVYCADCKNIGYINKVKNDELLRIYNTAYKTKHAQKQRSIRGKSKATEEKYNNVFVAWREAARLKLIEAQTGVITIDAFKEFLNKKLEV